MARIAAAIAAGAGVRLGGGLPGVAGFASRQELGVFAVVDGHAVLAGRPIAQGSGDTRAAAPGP